MSPDPFANIRPAQHNGNRLPYQPLLALYALGRWARGERDTIRFVDAEGPLRELMAELGLRATRTQAELPFWALRSSGDWEVTPADLPARIRGLRSIRDTTPRERCTGPVLGAAP